MRDGPPVRTAQRISGFATTIFTELTALAQQTDAVNLGQGVPHTDGPPAAIEAARQAVASGVNQYPPLDGSPALREAVARQRLRRYGTGYDPSSEVLVTTGATEALAAAVLALCDPGDEIVVFDPCYDAYPAMARLAGAECRRVPLRNHAGSFTFDPEELRSAISPSTRLILLNTPHNPTGKVFTEQELRTIAKICVAHDLTAVCDEVYEYLTYDGRRHLPLAALPRMRERTLAVSSAGKTFSLTGWKVGWACGPTHLVGAVRAVKQYLSFAGGAPFQGAVALALEQEEPWIEQLRLDLQAARDTLAAGLRSAGAEVVTPEGGYFVQADVRRLEPAGAAQFCRALPHRSKVVAIPTGGFAKTAPEEYAHLARFAFCKNRDVLQHAAEAISTTHRAHTAVPTHS